MLAGLAGVRAGRRSGWPAFGRAGVRGERVGKLTATVSVR